MEVGVGGEGVDDLLECGHPRCGQVAVLQHHPAALLALLADERGGDWALASAERDGVQLRGGVAALRGEAQQGAHRVKAGRRHKEERRRPARVREGRVEVERRHLSVLAPHLLGDELGDARHERLGPEGPHDEQLREAAQLSPRAGERDAPRRRRPQQRRPCAHIGRHVRVDALERLDTLTRDAEQRPRRRADAVGARRQRALVDGGAAEEEEAPLRL